MKIICTNLHLFAFSLFHSSTYNHVMFLNCTLLSYLVIMYDCADLFELSRKSDKVTYPVLELWQIKNACLSFYRILFPIFIACKESLP